MGAGGLCFHPWGMTYLFPQGVSSYTELFLAYIGLFHGLLDSFEASLETGRREGKGWCCDSISGDQCCFHHAFL